MYFGAIWLKAIALIVLSIIITSCGIVAKAKLGWDRAYVAVTVFLAIGILIGGCITAAHAVTPSVRTVNLTYTQESKGMAFFGHEYRFTDDKGNEYKLSMDPLTHGQIFEGRQFNKNQTYQITYEKKSMTIVGIYYE